jgi:hypothetical protein
MHLRFERVLWCVLVLAGACSSETPKDDAPSVPGASNMMNTAGAGSTPAMSPSTAGPSSTPGQSSNPSSPSTPTSPGMTTPPATTPDPGTAGDFSDPTTPFASLPDKCKGFDVKGLKYSPGGNTLPNTCAPFHNIRNNPYAIRCVDADDTFNSGYLGDDMCILPPDPMNGTQVHEGPADYANVPEQFIMKPGSEITDWYYTKAPNTESHYFFRVNLRMRAGSHHMINTMLDMDHPDGFASSGTGFSAGGGGGSRSFPGSQRPDADRPLTFDVPPENAGLGDQINAKQQFSLNLHHFNLTDKPALREVWINIWYKPESEVTQKLAGIAMFGNPIDVAIAPGQKANLEYKCDVTGNTRIISMNGHRHSHTTRFGVWLIRDGKNIPLYDSFHYDDMPTFQYDTIAKNPVADPSTQTDGAFTGVLEVKPGDEMHFECDIDNDSTQTLRFANEVETGEMCILFGSRVGGALCGAGTRVQ